MPCAAGALGSAPGHSPGRLRSPSQRPGRPSAPSHDVLPAGAGEVPGHRRGQNPAGAVGRGAGAARHGAAGDGPRERAAAGGAAAAGPDAEEPDGAAGSRGAAAAPGETGAGGRRARGPGALHRREEREAVRAQEPQAGDPPRGADHAGARAGGGAGQRHRGRDVRHRSHPGHVHADEQQAVLRRDLQRDHLQHRGHQQRGEARHVQAGAGRAPKPHQRGGDAAADPGQRRGAGGRQPQQHQGHSHLHAEGHLRGHENQHPRQEAQPGGNPQQRPRGHCGGRDADGEQDAAEPQHRVQLHHQRRNDEHHQGHVPEQHPERAQGGQPVPAAGRHGGDGDGDDAGAVPLRGALWVPLHAAGPPRPRRHRHHPQQRAPSQAEENLSASQHSPAGPGAQLAPEPRFGLPRAGSAVNKGYGDTGREAAPGTGPQGRGQDLCVGGSAGTG